MLEIKSGFSGRAVTILLTAKLSSLQRSQGVFLLPPPSPSFEGRHALSLPLLGTTLLSSSTVVWKRLMELPGWTAALKDGSLENGAMTWLNKVLAEPGFGSPAPTSKTECTGAHPSRCWELETEGSPGLLAPV